MTTVSPQDPWFQVSEVLRLIRSGQAQTRPELADATRLGRNVITARIQAAQELELIEPAGSGRSRGGRAAEVWRFRGAAGHVLIAMVGTRRLRVALADLDATVLGLVDIPWTLDGGPEMTCERIASEMERLLCDAGVERPWGICVGLPAPVDFTTGQSVDPVAPSEAAYRWPVDFDVRAWFSGRFRAPSWTDAVSNLMALGAAAAPDAPADLVFVRLGTGLGAGLVMGGRVQRGATWLAGELNHVTVGDDPDRVCLCGRVGCLDTYAGGWAMLADAKHALAAGRAPRLAELLAGREPTLDDLAEAARLGEVSCVEIVIRASDRLGRALASMITWLNPAQVTVGGFRVAQSELFRAGVERAVRAASLAASTRGLVIAAGDPDQLESIAGAVELVADSLISPGYLAEWGPLGSPLEAPGIRLRDAQV